MVEIESIIASNARQLMRLLSGVAALKSSPVEQRQLLVDGLQSIFQTKIGWLMVADDYRPNRQIKMVHQVLTSDVTPDWMRYMGEFAVKFPLEADVYGACTIRSDDVVQVWKRHEVLPDQATAEKYPASLAAMELLEVDEAAVAAFRTGPNGDRLIGFAMHRDKHAPRFTTEEFALIRLAIEEIREMEQCGYIEFREPLEGELTPRLQQVLDRLLTGKAPKEIATDLHLSIHTVREHVNRLYRRYNVTSREDLTAKFLR